MAVNITLPVLGAQKQGTKDAVISILSHEWPLSAKEIFNQLKRENSNGISYQAVHKTLKQLEVDRFLSRTGAEYSLNKECIGRTCSFYNKLQESYSNGVTNPSDPANVTCTSLYETDKFLLSMMEQGLPPRGEKPFVGLHWSHFWIPLFLSVNEYNQIKNLAPRFDMYSISRANTAMDKWCADFWRSHNANVVTGVDFTSQNNILIYNDTVVSAYYPVQIRKELDAVFSSVKKIEDLDVNYLFENLFQKPAKIPLTINKNPVLAKQLEEETMSYFKGDGE